MSWNADELIIDYAKLITTQNHIKPLFVNDINSSTHNIGQGSASSGYPFCISCYNTMISLQKHFAMFSDEYFNSI